MGIRGDLAGIPGEFAAMSVRFLQGDCRSVLATLPDASVHCVVTSPPYWGLREYGTATWEGGNPVCEHVVGEIRTGLGMAALSEKYRGGGRKQSEPKPLYAKGECPHCGALRIDQQIGLEQSPDAYVAEMVTVFREVRRVLRDDGTVFLNLGDSYSSGGRATYRSGASDNKGHLVQNDMPRPASPDGVKPKDLIGLPWMVAFALRADGWYLRSDIIWAKRNCMPESVRDRPTTAHEHIFLLTKQPKYFYDAVAIEEEGEIAAGTRAAKGSVERARQANGRPPEYAIYTGKRNKRSVWWMATQPFSEAHFATFPAELAETCIKAGTSERGCCSACGAPWVRVTERTDQGYDGSVYGERAVAASGGAKTGGTARSTLGSSNGKLTGVRKTNGWRSSCSCVCSACEGGGLGPVEHAPNAPGGLAEVCCKECEGTGVPFLVSATVLDPFSGAGTTALVADRLGRNAIGIELNPEYVSMSKRRLVKDAGMFADV